MRIRYLFFCFGLVFIPAVLCSSKAAAQGYIPINTNLIEQSSYLDTAVINRNIEQGKRMSSSAPDSAIAILRTSLWESDRMGYPDGIINALRSLSEAYINKGELDSCLLLCRQALDRYRYSFRFRQVLPFVYNILGNIAKMQNNYSQAVTYYFAALGQVDPSFVNHSGAVYNNLATVLIPLGQYEEALSYLTKAEHLSRVYKNYDGLANALLNKGIIYGRKQQWNEGRQYMDSALLVAKAHHLIPVHYLTLAHLGGLYLQKQMPEQTLDYLFEAQRLNGSVNPDYQVFAWMLMGRAYLELHRYQQAEASLLKGLALAKAHQLNQLPAHALLAQVYKQTGQYRQALAHFEAYKEINDELTGKQVAQDINQLNIRYKTVQKDKEIARSQLLISTQKNRLKNQRIWAISILSGSIIIMLCLWMRYRAYKHKHILTEKLQEIKQLKASIRGEEKERHRIARELHDGIVSQLMAIRLGIHALKERKSIILPEELEAVYSQVRDAADDLRKTAHNLIPDTLGDQGLAPAVALLCEKTRKSAAIEVILEIFNPIPRYDADVELSSYRMIQELIQNVLKHARAATLLVQLSCRNQMLYITVEDDGVGMPEKSSGQGAGLKNIKDRIKAIGGMIRIEKVATGGTAIYVEHRINLSSEDIIAHAH